MESISHRANASENKIEDRRETGLSLIVIAGILWFFDALIFFFLPAGIKLGEQRAFALVTGSVFLLGAVLMSVGFYLRKK